MNFSLHHSTTYLYLLLIAILSLSACRQEESIATITSFSVTQSTDNLTFSFASSSQNIIYYEIDYYSPNGGSQGNFATNESSTVTKTIAELSLQTGVLYVFTIRAIINNPNNSNVISGADPVSLNIGDFCGTPTSLSFVPASGFNWSNNNSTSTSYYEISYGITGTLAIDGEKITTNNTSNNEMVLEQGEVYDFYVRSYCNNTLGWSNWEGPLTEYTSQSLNVCIPPSNLAFTVVRNSLSQAVGARCTWDDNGGNSNYEVNMVGNGSSATAGNIETSSSLQITYSPMTQNTEYDFYVRTICSDGTPTSWVGPLNVNIGQ